MEIPHLSLSYVLVGLITLYFSFKLLRMLLGLLHHWNLVKHIPGKVQLLRTSLVKIPFLAPYMYHNNQKMMDQLNKQFGSIWRMALWDRAFIFVSKPEDLKQVMVRKSNDFPKPPNFYDALALYGENILTLLGGENWKRRRAVCDPAFGVKNLQYLSQVSTDCMHKIFRRWEHFGNSFEIDAEKEAIDITMEIIGLAGFGYDLGVLETKEEKQATFDKSKYHMSFREALEITTSTALIYRVIFPSFMLSLFGKEKHGVEDANKYMEEIIQSRVKEINQGKSTRMDLFSLLIKANSEISDTSVLKNPDAEENDEGEVLKMEKMSVEELKSDTWVFLAAGHETTASQLQWTLNELAIHPEIQEKCYQHIINVLGSATTEPTYEDFEKLSYVNQIVYESLRMHPPVYAVPKYVTSENIELNGYKIPKNVTIMCNIRQIHNDEQYWPQPRKFTPERFEQKYNPLTWIPFSAGSRKCIGFMFSLVESCIILTKLIQQYTVHLPEDVDRSTMFDPRQDITIKPKNKRIILKKREHSV